MRKNSWVTESIPEYDGESLAQRLISKGTKCLSNKELISLSMGASTNKISDDRLEDVLEQIENNTYN